MKKKLVSYLFKYIEKEFDYLILRNHENLPEDEGHDIDILIHKLEAKKIDDLLSVLELKFNVIIFKNYRYNNLKSHIIVFDDTILHLDFFTSVQWNRIDLFSTKILLKSKIRFKNILWILNPNDFEKYCWYLYIIRKGKLKKEKYIKNANIFQNSLRNQTGIFKVQNLNNKFNKLIFVFSFFKKKPLSFIISSLNNIIFKFNKIIYPYGRIFHYESDIRTQSLCSEYCFINHQVFNYPIHDFLAIFKIYYALTNETGVVISKEFYEKNPEVNLFLRKFIVQTTSDLKESVSLIYK